MFVLGRLGREPLGAGRGPRTPAAERAAAARRPLEDRGRRQRALLGRHRRPRDGRRRRGRARRRTRAAHRRRSRGHARRARARRGVERLRGRRERRRHERRHGRRPRRRRRRLRATTGSGSTSTAPTAAPGSRRRRCASATGASSAPTRSSSTRTSGCSRPTTAARSLYRDPAAAYGVFRQEAGYLDTVNQPDAAWSEWNPRRLRLPPVAARPRPALVVLARDLRHRRLPRRRRAGARRSRARRPSEIRRAAGARAGDGARAVGRAVPPARVGRRRLRGLVAPAARGADRLRAADDLARREGRAPVLREPRARRSTTCGRCSARWPEARRESADLASRLQISSRDRHQPRDPLLGRRMGREQAA